MSVLKTYLLLIYVVVNKKIKVKLKKDSNTFSTANFVIPVSRHNGGILEIFLFRILLF